ncbi:hypothetical protein [Citrobacter pasteurii]|nr:hypothetical protein SF123566_5457 [Shigella flexneri 1235-66]CEJ63740.1 hypothetical protein [Citrobacter pasteurii]
MAFPLLKEITFFIWQQVLVDISCFVTANTKRCAIRFYRE